MKFLHTTTMLMLLLLGWSTSAQAQGPSLEGCQSIDGRGGYGGSFESAPPGGFQWFAGDTIDIIASTPSGGVVDNFELLIGGVQVEVEAFPGMLSYTFPADEVSASYYFGVVNRLGNATFTISCASNPIPPAPAVTATPVPTMSAYGLILTMLTLIFVAVRRLRVLVKRK